MQIKLNLKPVPGFVVPAYDPDLDCIIGILTDVCEALHKTGSEFVVSGFGDDRWSVDVATDMCIFMEQVPFAHRAVCEGLATRIDFPEQGVERFITLEPTDGQYLATCKAWVSDLQADPTLEWVPCLEVPFGAAEEIPREALEEMLLRARDAFMHAMAGMAPELPDHPWVREWLKGETAY